MAQLNCIVVTPEATQVDEKADFVAVTLFDGELGIAPEHSPMIGRLGFGEMRLKSGGQTHRYYIDGGFVQVADNIVSVLTSRAIAADQVDGEVAREQLKTALERKADSPELMEIRDRAVAQARAQMRISQR